MRKNLYEAFTLVEMLIVMGILIILMAVGITAGRFAINRANEVAHQDAVKQIYTALQAYYTDHREFPVAATPEDLIDGETAPLYSYLDQGAFNGGTEADYIYFVGDGQAVLVCVSLGGAADDKNLGYYCDGNGFGDSTLTLSGAVTAANLTDKKVPYESGGTIYNAVEGGTNKSTWYGGTKWTAPV